MFDTLEDEALLNKARSTFREYGYHSQQVDLALALCGVEIEAARYDVAKNLMIDIKDLTEEHTKPDLKNETAFLLGQVYLATDQERKVAPILTKVRHHARGQYKLRLVRMCDEIIDTLIVRQ